MTRREVHDEIAALLARWAADDGAMVTGWSVVVETYDPDEMVAEMGAGRGYRLHRMADDASPEWRVRGFMSEALDHWTEPAYWDAPVGDVED